MSPLSAFEVFPFLKSSTLIFLSDSDFRFQPGVPGVLGLGFGFGFGLFISLGFAESRAESRCGGTGGRGLQ